jgi:Protein of unknown function (DUF1186)/SEC-C motif
LACASADLCPEEVMAELGKTYAEDLADPGVVGWDEVEEALAMGKEAAMAELPSRYALVSDVHKEMSWWAGFRENQQPPVRDDLLLPSEYEVVDPIYRTEPKIGRNDPCSCGSGKKYKKCCGR